MAAAELPGPPFPSRPEPSALKTAPKPKPPPLPGAPHFGQVVIGPPGAGKTTYCWGVQQFLQACGRYCITAPEGLMTKQGLTS